MKVLFAYEQPVIDNSAPALRILGLAKALSKLGCSVFILPDQDVPSKLLSPNNRLSKYLTRLYVFVKMVEIIKREKIKCIICRSFYMGLMAVLLSKIFRTKSFFDFHGFVWHEEIYRGHRVKSMLTRVLEKICVRYSYLIITQNKNNFRIAKFLNKNVILLENGIDPDIYMNVRATKNILLKYKISSSKPIIGFIGNWENWMKIEDVLKASQYVPNTTFVIVGAGRRFDYYQQKYKNIIFTGKIQHNDVVQLLHHFFVCIAPYSGDDIMFYKSAVKTIEYIAAGKPIIVSDVPGKDEFLVPNKNCLTYEPGNPQSLAKKIQILISNSELRTLITQNNKELVERYSWVRILERSGLIAFMQNFC